MLNMGQPSTWSHASFFALLQRHTQNKLQQAYSNSLFIHLLSLLDQRQAIKTISEAGPGAAAFLHAPTTLLADLTLTYPNAFSNQAITRPMLQQGYFATHWEHTKRAKYGKAAQILGAKFVPLVLETLGSFGPVFLKFFTQPLEGIFQVLCKF